MLCFDGKKRSLGEASKMGCALTLQQQILSVPFLSFFLIIISFFDAKKFSKNNSRTSWRDSKDIHSTMRRLCFSNNTIPNSNRSKQVSQRETNILRRTSQIAQSNFAPQRQHAPSSRFYKSVCHKSSEACLWFLVLTFCLSQGEWCSYFLTLKFIIIYKKILELNANTTIFIEIASYFFCNWILNFMQM